MAIYSNLSIDQGTDFNTVIDLETLDNQPFDITNYSVRGQIRKTYASTNYIDFNAVITDYEAGKITISLTSEITKEMKAGRYVYDIEIVSINNKVTRVLEGQLEITPAVTRIPTNP